MRAGRSASGERTALGAAFLRAALRYWLLVFPVVDRELRRLRRRAQEIPDPNLRAAALAGLEERGNIEGAAAFAAFVPSHARRDALDALVAFQAAYNYTDTLAEQPSHDPAANARRLHEALCVALDPAASHLDYYEHQAHEDDSGYLVGMLDTCRSSLNRLPSYPAAADAARRTAARIVGFQSLTATAAEHDSEALERWARAIEVPGSGLAWWETAAASGSSLPTLALIAAAGDRELDAPQVLAIERAYFPWAGALSSLLDSLVDRDEDARAGQLSLVGCYPSARCAARGMARIATGATRATRSLSGGQEHLVVLAGMVGFYAHAARHSSSANAWQPEVQGILEGVLAGVGPAARAALAVFRARSLAARFVHRARRLPPTAIDRRASTPECC